MTAFRHAKILILVHHFPPTFKGGAEWRAHRTATWMQKQGHTVQVICVESMSDSQTEGLRYEDTEFQGLSVRRLYLNMSQFENPARMEYDNPLVGEHIDQFIRDYQPDLVHLISGYLMTATAIQAIKRHQIPLLATLTDFWFLCPRHTLQRTSGEVCPENTSLDCARCHYELQRRYRLPAQRYAPVMDMVWQGAQFLPPVSAKTAEIDRRTTVLKEALALVDVAVCPSNFLLQMYQSKGFKAKKMVFMRQGLQELPPTVPEKTPADSLRVGYIGSIAAHKGVQLLVEAFLPFTPDQATLKFYGDTEQFPEFYQQLQQLSAGHTNIEFMGTFNREQLADVHANMDVLVVPSTWYENSPNVILEAYAYKTPIITTNLGGMAELVQHEQTGLLFEPNNVADITRQIQVIIDQPKVLSDWREQLNPIKDLETEMQDLYRLYESLL